MNDRDLTVAAYVDGELDTAARARFEADMARDPSLADAVAAQRRLRARLAAAYDPVLSEPVPPALRMAAEAANDRPARRFQFDGHPFRLPAREFDVLWELMTPVGRVCSKRELAAKLSDLDDLLADNALEAFISRLRKKLAGSGARIRTLRGLGYVLEPEA